MELLFSSIIVRFSSNIVPWQAVVLKLYMLQANASAINLTFFAKNYKKYCHATGYSIVTEYP